MTKMRTHTVKRLTQAVLSLLMILTLAGCTSKDEPDENSGLYKAVSVNAFGMELGVDDIFDDPITIELQDGGKAVFSYEGKDYKMKWSHTEDSFEAKGGGAKLNGTLRDGVMELTDILDSGVDIRLECEEIMSRTSGTDDASVDGTAADTDDEELSETGALPEDVMQLIDTFEGDWYGMVRVNHAYDGYSDNEDAEMYATARFSFDETGDVTTYLCASVAPVSANFLNITATTSPSINSIVVNFDFFEGHSDDVYLSVNRGLLNGVADIVNDNGDELDISLALRRIGEEWTDDDKEIYWTYAAEYAHLAIGETTETLAAAWLGDEYPTPIPEPSYISSEGALASAGDGSGATGKEDEETESGADDDTAGVTTDDKYVYAGSDSPKYPDDIPADYPLVPHDRFVETFKAISDGKIGRSSTYEDVAAAFGNEGIRWTGYAYEGAAYYYWYSDEDYGNDKVHLLVTFLEDGDTLKYYAYTSVGITAQDVQ